MNSLISREVFLRDHCPKKGRCEFNNYIKTRELGQRYTLNNCELRQPPDCTGFLQGLCGFWDSHGVPHTYSSCSFYHPKTAAFSEYHETITKLRHEIIMKIDKLDKLVEDLRADIPSLVQPTLDSKVAAYEAEKLEVNDDILREWKGEIKVKMTGKFKDYIKTDLAGDLDEMKRIKENVDDNLTPAVKNLQEKLSYL